MANASALPRILFFNINGSGMGHLSRCLAYARRLRGRAEPVFFSLASAMEIIHDMGFQGDYFVSDLWSRSHINAWERELAVRLGLMLEEVRPAVVVFDGTWPFHGFMTACDVCRVPRRVWSNRGLHKKEFKPVPIKESAFDLVIQPGEIGASFSVERPRMPGRKVTTAPVTLLRNDELLERDEARNALGLERSDRYALLSLGPGNFKDVGAIAHGLIGELRERGCVAVWAQAPISVRDVPLPDHVLPISVYPLVRYMRAFDFLIGAAGYNTCCEVVQSAVPALLVPNIQLADDQARRAEMLSRHCRVVVSPCETSVQRSEAVRRLLAFGESAVGGTSGLDTPDAKKIAERIDLTGAERAAEEILALVGTRQP